MQIASTLEKTAYITFDDGPQESTYSLLDLMNNLDVRATFFVLEPQMRKYKDLICTMMQYGHAIGLHGVSHDRKIYSSPDAFIEEMNICNHTLKEITGANSRLVRAPYGSYPNMNSEFKGAVREAGYILWDWNVDSNDWWMSADECISLSKIQILTLQNQGLAPIILFHDHTTNIKEVVGSIIKFLKYHNYSVKPLTPDLIPICHGE
ncbi:MAG TPA: polysaccharide deacetylase family protein [Syntrophomonadaceae bacterium]|nr:polysaccharide deacetylase family protein [Syntrophomonadaceae bacterium]